MMLLNGSLLYALSVCLVSLLITRGNEAQVNNDLPPDCDLGMENIKKCITAAVDAAAATGCNWYRLIRPLDSCIREAVAGCFYDEQQVWYEYVTSFNKTLTTDDCYPACTGQNTRAQRMFQCFNEVSFEQLIMDISLEQDVQSLSTSCLTLNAVRACLLGATNGCPALTDISHDRIYNTPYSADAFTKCGIVPFQGATTNAPVALLDTNSMRPDPLSTTRFPGALTESETWLVTIGSIVIITTIIVVIIAIVLAIRRRRAEYHRSLLRDWRPNGHKVFIDEPKFYPAQNANLYRPIAISHNSGFLEDRAHVQ